MKKVSVLCCVYNQDIYVAKMLDGILSQKTSFEYEVIVHDDVSTDNTREILDKYKERFGDKIKIVYEQENQFSKGKLTEAIDEIVKNTAEGDYIALCEGDDFWIDNNKLQIQIDYMEKHPTCSLTGHNSLLVDAITNDMTPCNGVDREGIVSIQEIIGNRRGCFSTASMVIRKDNYVMSPIFSDCSIGDWPLKLSCANCGEVYYFDRIMSVYNVHARNSWTNSTTYDTKKRIDHNLEMISYLLRLNQYWENRYQDEIDVQIESYINDIIYQLKSQYKEVEKSITDVNNELGTEYCDARELVINKIRVKEIENNALRNFARNHSHKYIMGCGIKAKKLKELLDELEVEIDGFVVSNNQIAPFEYCGKKAWRLCDIPYEKNTVAIIVGIQNDIRDEILLSLRANGIEEYFWPSI